MTPRDRDVADRVLRAFISGYLMHLHLVYIYCNNQSMIAIVAVRPNVILSRQYRFPQQKAPFIFIFWQNVTYCSKSIPFLLRLNYVLKTHSQKEITDRAISYRDIRW
jgi:hypothetical protein